MSNLNDKPWFVYLQRAPCDAAIRHTSLIEFLEINGVLFFHIKDLLARIKLRWGAVERIMHAAGLLDFDEHIPHHVRYKGFYIRADAAIRFLYAAAALSRGKHVARRVDFVLYFKRLVDIQKFCS